MPRSAPRALREVPAQLLYPGHEPSPATVGVVRYSDPERMLRAFGGGAACWGMAVVTVFIPLGHLILVPAFLIAGPVVFLQRLHEQASFRGVLGHCPACGAEQRFAEHGRLLERTPLRCTACGRRLEMALAAVEPAAPAARA